MWVRILNLNTTGLTLSADDRANFLSWYVEQNDKIFHNKEALLAYCTDDVIVLRQACCSFRNLFLKWVKWTHTERL